MSLDSRVVRRPLAEHDIEQQVDYYIFESRSPETALRFVSAVEATLEVLASHPHAGSPCWGALEGYRRKPVVGFEKHLVFYRATEIGIELVRVLHGVRDIDTIFTEEP